MHNETPVTVALSRMGIPFEFHLHETPLRSLEQAARERGLRPEQIVRSLLFRTESAVFIMVLVPGPRKVAWPKLRSYLEVSRITTADEEQVEAVTGYPIGGVSPFGLKQPVRLLADQRLADLEIISLGAGIRNAGVILKSKHLLEHLKPELGDFTA